LVKWVLKLEREKWNGFLPSFNLLKVLDLNREKQWESHNVQFFFLLLMWLSKGELHMKVKIRCEKETK
jgi:hypothetical protein